MWSDENLCGTCKDKSEEDTKKESIKDEDVANLLGGIRMDIRDEYKIPCDATNVEERLTVVNDVFKRSNEYTTTDKQDKAIQSIKDLIAPNGFGSNFVKLNVDLATNETFRNRFLDLYSENASPIASWEKYGKVAPPNTTDYILTLWRKPPLDLLNNKDNLLSYFQEHFGLVPVVVGVENNHLFFWLHTKDENFEKFCCDRMNHGTIRWWEDVNFQSITIYERTNKHFLFYINTTLHDITTINYLFITIFFFIPIPSTSCCNLIIIFIGYRSQCQWFCIIRYRLTTNFCSSR